MGVMNDEQPVISPADMDELLAQHRPGATYSADALWTAYVRQMEEARRPLATRNALGRALTAAGAVRRRVRRRVSGKPIEVASWVLPGEDLGTEVDHQHVLAVMDDLGDGEHSEADIIRRYAELGRREGWRGMLTQTRLVRLLTTMGYVRIHRHGAPYRIVLARKAEPQPSRFFQG